MLRVNVKGGAGSGCKRPLKPPAADWRCGNGHANQGRNTRCMTTGCREKRP